jgi:hypothetical protein
MVKPKEEPAVNADPNKKRGPPLKDLSPPSGDGSGGKGGGGQQAAKKKK